MILALILLGALAVFIAVAVALSERLPAPLGLRRRQ